MAPGVAFELAIRDITDEADLIIGDAKPGSTGGESPKDESLACAFDTLLTVFDTE